MNDKHKHEVDELLSLYLDDEATERQRTELKRLLRHDESIAERLKVMKRQRQMLAALPAEAAPASMVDDVRAALERNLILDDVSGGAESASGTNHLFARRMLSNAAMLLLPLGLLAMVVFQIIKPPAKNEIPYVKTDEVLSGKEVVSEGAVEPVLADAGQMPFDGTLTFTTDQQITVSNFVEKMIFDTGLIHDTMPNRTSDVTRYSISASPARVATLLETLEVIWPRCQAVTLDLDSGDDTVAIADIRLEQIKTLVAEDSPEMYQRLATRYASANLKKDTLLAEADKTDDEFPPLRQPILTGRNALSAAAGDDGQPPIKLKIYIKRTIE